MINIISRRDFLRTSVFAGLWAMETGRVFADATGVLGAGKPALAFGLLADVHVCLAAKKKPGFAAGYDTEDIVKAFTWFRDNGADAVVIAGDIAHCGLAGELKALADAWFKVFPNDKAPDGRKVERVFVFGNHDWSSLNRAATVFGDKEERDANLLVVDPKKWWDEIFHEEWIPCFEKRVNGYRFECIHWNNGGCNGKREVFNKGIAEYYASLKEPLDAKLPFFHVQHPHPRGTVHGEKVWGQDDGVSAKVLSAYPNAISFSGHSHTSLTDERSIWQGAFTSIGCASLRDVSLSTPGVPLNPVAGPENGPTPKEAAAHDALKAMFTPGRMNCRQGQFVKVFADRIVLSRREFVVGEKLTDDLVMPLPAAESKPFAFATRVEKAPAPSFPENTKIVAKKVHGNVRSGKGNLKRKTDVWEFDLPQCVGPARATGYRVTARGADGNEIKLGLANEAVRFAADGERGKMAQVCRIACERLDPGKPSITARAVSCWNKESDGLEISVGMTIIEGRNQARICKRM